MLHIAKNIKFIRKSLGLTQESFVQHFGDNTSVAMLKSYEGGKAKPDMVFIEKLSSFSGVPEKDLRDKELKLFDIKVNKEELVEKIKKVEVEDTKKPDELDITTKYIRLLEKTNNELSTLKDELMKEIAAIKHHLDEVSKDHLTIAAMNAASHEVMLSALVDHDKLRLARLQQTSHNIFVEKMLDFRQRGIVDVEKDI